MDWGKQRTNSPNGDARPASKSVKFSGTGEDIEDDDPVGKNNAITSGDRLICCGISRLPKNSKPPPQTQGNPQSIKVIDEERSATQSSLSKSANASSGWESGDASAQAVQRPETLRSAPVDDVETFVESRYASFSRSDTDSQASFSVFTPDTVDPRTLSEKDGLTEAKREHRENQRVCRAKRLMGRSRANQVVPKPVKKMDRASGRIRAREREEDQEKFEQGETTECNARFVSPISALSGQIRKKERKEGRMGELAIHNGQMSYKGFLKAKRGNF